MNDRPPTLASALTARQHVALMLTREILENPETKDFLIGSEHALCRRFNTSRVTVRLALSDLEHRGLIYRKHGRGTFAHGRSTRTYRNLAILLKSPPKEKKDLAEIIRGAHAVMSTLHSALVLISVSPREWTPEMSRALAGVLIIPDGIMMEDLESLKNRNLPFLLVGRAYLPGPRILLSEEEEIHLQDRNRLYRSQEISTLKGEDFFHLGKLAAEFLCQSALTSEPVTEISSLFNLNDTSCHCHI